MTLLTLFLRVLYFYTDIATLVIRLIIIISTPAWPPPWSPPLAASSWPAPQAITGSNGYLEQAQAEEQNSHFCRYRIQTKARKADDPVVGSDFTGLPKILRVFRPADQVCSTIDQASFILCRFED